MRVQPAEKVQIGRLDRRRVVGDAGGVLNMCNIYVSLRDTEKYKRCWGSVNTAKH